MARNDTLGRTTDRHHDGHPSRSFDAASSDATSSPAQIVDAILEAARTYLDADVVFVSQLVSARQMVRWSVGDAASFGLRNGSSGSLSQTYCAEMIDGRLPRTVPDTRTDAVAHGLEVTRRLRIGAYAGVPIFTAAGRLYGTFSAVSHEARPRLNREHERFLVVLSGLIAEQITRIDADMNHRRDRFERIRRTLDAARTIRIALQPIVDLESGFVVGEEALARFSDARSPIAWFAEAWDVGLGTDLEIATLRVGRTLMDQIPSHAYLSVNVSPQTVLTPALRDLVSEWQPTRLVLEMTEHRDVHDYGELARALDEYRERGVRLAVDDVGAGFASLSHVLRLDPDIIKLDLSLTHGVDHDPARRALVSSLLTFSSRIGAAVVAEGIETEQELDALRILGIGFGQGHLLGSPGHGVVRRMPRGFATSSSALS